MFLMVMVAFRDGRNSDFRLCKSPTNRYFQCIHRHPDQTDLDFAADDDGAKEYEIASVRFYDEGPCELCNTSRMWYIIGYAGDGAAPSLKDEGAGFSLGRLLKAVYLLAPDDLQQARKILLAKTGDGDEDFGLFGFEHGQRVPLEQLFPQAAEAAAAVAAGNKSDDDAAAVDIADEVVIDACGNGIEREFLSPPAAAATASTSFNITFSPQLLFPYAQTPFAMMQNLFTIGGELQQQMTPYFLNSPQSAFHPPTNAVALRDVTNYSPVSSASSRTPTPFVRNRIAHRAHMRQVWRSIDAADRNAEDERPGTASSTSSSSSSNISQSTDARDQRKLALIRQFDKNTKKIVAFATRIWPNRPPYCASSTNRISSSSSATRSRHKKRAMVSSSAGACCCY
uniref:Uncharacterized protein n=1 Tax=Globodera rostochiensis TaxID=31243 RepID=A0A914H0Z4_GLORO